ncbi:hypothetical protein GN958_ATG03124 [Phytophthora infestans]|uniref:Uncharacterized protein n=1 Tax=Phytophthora infestans TaxID=4787 RepID=A0A8S9V9A0_PHYIN|nr:hypothetical protein GN958_ATG03124 [Phytophthora infestans]
MFREQLAVVLILVTAHLFAAESVYTAENFYSDDDSCNGVPNVIRATEDVNCTRATCFTDPSNNTVRTECHSDYMEAFRHSIGEDYIVQVVYKDSDRDEFSYAIRYYVGDYCMTGFFESETLRRDTTGDLGTKRIAAKKGCVADFTTNIFPGYHKWYTSEDEDDGGLSDGFFACIICGCILLFLVITLFVVVHQEKKRNAKFADAPVDVIVTSIDATQDGQLFSITNKKTKELGLGQSLPSLKICSR